MAAQRELCKVGDSPTQRQRSLSPRRGSGGRTPEDNPDDPPKIKVAAPPEVPRSPSKGERRISTRLKGVEGSSSSPKASPKHTAWKTSKFFSRSMASGELLKGFGKKLSGGGASSPAAATVIVTDEGGAAGPSDAVVVVAAPHKEEKSSFKSRFSSLRRKSGSDTDTVPNVDSESLKHGSADVRGIVCKKEDLLHLIAKVPEGGGRRGSTPAELVVPCALPTSPVPPLKSPSIKVAPPLKAPSFRSGGRSASLDPTALPNIERRPPLATTKQPAIRAGLYPADDIGIRKGSFLEVVPEVKRRLSGPLIDVRAIKEETEEEEEEAVQWDEANFVDPALLGGAIEAFLKGMGPSSPTPPPQEKRVSFKKNLIK